MNTRLRLERVNRGWTQSFVANAAGISNAALQRIETGKRKPSYDVLVKLLELFEYNDPRQLFAAVDES